MNLAVGIVVFLLIFYLFQKVVGRLRKGAATGNDLNDKTGLSPATGLALRTPPDEPKAESGETITVIVTEGDDFHDEWEIIPDSDQDENQNRPDTLYSQTLH